MQIGKAVPSSPAIAKFYPPSPQAAFRVAGLSGAVAVGSLLRPEVVPAHCWCSTSAVQVGPVGSAGAWPCKLSPSLSMFHTSASIKCNCIGLQLEKFTGSCVPSHLLLLSCVEQKRCEKRGGQRGSYAVSLVVELSIWVVTQMQSGSISHGDGLNFQFCSQSSNAHVCSPGLSTPFQLTFLYIRA